MEKLRKSTETRDETSEKNGKKNRWKKDNMSTGGLKVGWCPGYGT